MKHYQMTDRRTDKRINQDKLDVYPFSQSAGGWPDKRINLSRVYPLSGTPVRGATK